MITVIVYGSPAPQGSKRFLGTYTGADGRTHAKLVEHVKAVKPWRQNVEAAALEAMDFGRRAALDGPLVASMVFTLPKPTSAPKKRVTFADKKPDLSKLCRSTEDALKTGGVWKDDARVVGYVKLWKVFPGEDLDALNLPGVRVHVWTMAEYLTARLVEIPR